MGVFQLNIGRNWSNFENKNLLDLHPIAFVNLELITKFVVLMSSDNEDIPIFLSSLIAVIIRA